jgi:hypothetical protein
MVGAPSLSLRELAAALGGDVAGMQVLAPGPGHSARDRSLAVKPSPDAPDGFLVWSHAGDDWRDCRDYVRSKLGLPAWEPGDDRHRERTIPQRHIDRWDFAAIDAEAQDRRRSEDDLVAIGRAQTLWAEAGDPRIPRVKRYLESRALALPAELTGSGLRYHPRTPWRHENTGETLRIPCLLAAFRSIDEAAVTAIHRIRLDRPELWPKAERRMLGSVRRSAVMMDAANDQLVIGEGVETCLAARQLGFEPVWAVGSVGLIAQFPLIDGVQGLIILAELGAASDRSVRICGRRWLRAGRRVFVSRSPVGSDHNDYLISLRNAGASQEHA